MKRICLLTGLSLLFISSYSQTVPEPWFPVYKDGQMGYINKAGKLVIDCNLDPIESYSLENATEEVFIVKHDDQYYIVDRQAKLVSPTGYDKLAIDKKHKLIRAENGTSTISISAPKQISWLNYQGQPAFADKFSCGFMECGYYFGSNNLWVFSKDGKKGAINMKGQVVVEPKYASLSDFKNGYAVFRMEENGKKGLLSQTGKVMISARYEEISSAGPGGNFFAVKNTPTGKLTVAVNISGKEIKTLGTLQIGYVYTKLATDENNNAIVQDTVTKLFGLVNYKGDVLVKPKYSGFIFGLSEGLVAFNTGGTRQEHDNWYERTGGQWVIVNTAGRELCKPFAAEKLGNFSEGLAPVLLKGQWGFVNTSGQIVIKPQFEEKPDGFENGLCRIIKQAEDFDELDEIGYINRKGEMVWEVQH